MSLILEHPATSLSAALAALIVVRKAIQVFNSPIQQLPEPVCRLTPVVDSRSQLTHAICVLGWCSLVLGT